MINIKILRFFLLTSTICVNSYAGLNGLTHHSRANCVNNESISWDFTQNHNMSVSSDHYYMPDGKLSHFIAGAFENTWRKAAVHWGEAPVGKDWRVKGTHCIERPKKDGVEFFQEMVRDCSIYNGWWDYEK